MLGIILFVKNRVLIAMITPMLSHFYQHYLGSPFGLGVRPGFETRFKELSLNCLSKYPSELTDEILYKTVLIGELFREIVANQVKVSIDIRDFASAKSYYQLLGSPEYARSLKILAKHIEIKDVEDPSVSYKELRALQILAATEHPERLKRALEDQKVSLESLSTMDYAEITQCMEAVARGAPFSEEDPIAKSMKRFE